MTHRVDPKQVKADILRQLSEQQNTLQGALPEWPGHPGDHLSASVVQDVLVLNTAVIHNDHLEALHAIIHERAAQVGIDLED